MNTGSESVRARRYLLGAAGDEESADLEQELFEDDGAVDRIAAAEDDLIEDYIDDHLDAADRDRFERHYLAAPQHRVRMETIRRLRATAQPRQTAQPRVAPASQPKRILRYTPWLALAASLMIVVSAAFWMLSPANRPTSTSAGNQPGPQMSPAPPNPATAAAPRAFALTISPVAVRSATETPAVVVPADADVVVFQLESDGDGANLRPSRAVIRTVGGTRVWQGPAAADAGRRGVVGRVDVPRAALPADDYMMTLYGTDGGGVEREWMEYFVRVREK